MEKTKYNIDLINKIIERDLCKIIELPHKINAKCKLNFICKCGIEHVKGISTIFRGGGAFCTICTQKNIVNKYKQTNLKKYGVENYFQTKEFKDKNKIICLNKYGVEYAMQSKDIQNKSKETCIKKYGVENISQVSSIQKKKEDTCFRNHGVICSLKSKIIRDKIKQTLLNKYGVTNILKLDIFKDKMKKICLKRYGTEYASQSQNFKERVKDTCLRKYGCANIFQSELFKNTIKQSKLLKNIQKYKKLKAKINKYDTNLKRKNTCIILYGTEYVFQSQLIKDIIKQTNLKRYGVEHVLQNADIAERCIKNTKQWKNYISPCGICIKYQGYENFAYDDLIKNGYTLNDIITSRKLVPEIWYNNNGIKHRYYVDIYIPKINKMIEVKSKWTYDKNKEIVNLKAQECIKQGYNYEIWIYDTKRNNTIINNFN